MGKFQDLSGQKFGKLTAIKVVDEPVKGGNHKKWVCLCECGNKTVVTSDHLKKGDIKSCGCYFWGGSDTRIYRIWAHIKDRCYNKNHKSYADYGGRGITVCDEWLESSKAFYDWSIANGYKDGLTIDRIDNNKGYYPDNCRWTTSKIQANNTRWNHNITYKGETKSIQLWGEELGIKPNTLLYRIRRGWSIERAFTTPTVKRG